MCNTVGNIFRLGIVGGCCLALAMQFLVTFGCSFVTTGDGQNIGVWYVDDGTGTCIDWEDDAPDSFVKGAQSALTLATIAGFAAAVLVTIEWLLCEICCAGCVEGLAFCAAWIVGGGVFSIYGMSLCGDFENMDSQVTGQITGQDDSGNQCKWGTDATYMTVANITFLACGILLCCAPQPEPLCKQ